MPLSRNEIKHRAHSFSREWKGETSEKSERQTFWNEFFEVFGKKRKHLAAFEEPVKKLSGSWGYIDLFWPGTCLVESVGHLRQKSTCCSGPIPHCAVVCHQ
jgi:hypothetical protein